MLAIFLKALGSIGPILSAADEVQEVFKAASQVLNGDDQAELHKLLEDLRADREAGHARLQAKLAAAAGK